MVYNVRIKVFPDGTKQYLYCDEAKQKDFKRSLAELPDSYLDEELDDIKPERFINEESNKRAKQKVWDIARSNDWDWFATLTFDPKVVDRYDYDACVDLMKQWTKSLHYYGCDYIVVPEQHKDGAYHFHALIRGKPPLSPNPKVLKDGTVVYSLSNYSYGFTSLSRVKDEQSVATYLTKYLTKEMCVPSGRKRYWHSRGLNLPQFVYSEILSSGLVSLIARADFRKHIATPYGDYWLLEVRPLV